MKEFNNNLLSTTDLSSKKLNGLSVKISYMISKLSKSHSEGEFMNDCLIEMSIH